MHKVSGVAVEHNRTHEETHPLKLCEANHMQPTTSRQEVALSKLALAIQTFSYIVNALKFWLRRSGFIMPTDSIYLGAQ
jgi:hypothetical protein